jgi:hypothetical protein
MGDSQNHQERIEPRRDRQGHPNHNFRGEYLLIMKEGGGLRILEVMFSWPS